MSRARLPQLFSPARIGALQLPNRLVMAPLLTGLEAGRVV
jgi:2,4-dienoyl-CoA reductase-like NADH-dependent reductase (Old Yellow Enzyme family)